MKIKKMCKLKGTDLAEHGKKVKKAVRNPTHICSKCLRVSNDPGKLCRPEPLD